MKMKIELLPNYDKSWGVPAKATPNDAGIDLRAATTDKFTLIDVGDIALIPLGIKSEMDAGMEVQLRARSGRALREGLALVNGVGTIDAGYRGEWGAIVTNLGDKPICIERGDKIVQAVPQLLPNIDIEIGEVSDEGNRGGGFGSTGN